MSDNEEDRTTYKSVVLYGADNFAQWELSIGTTLLGKGLLDGITSEIPSLQSAKERLRSGKAFALVIQSLSAVVQQSLSAAARSITSPNPKLVWDEVKAQYSASVGSRQAALIQDIWRRQIEEGDDPIPHLGRVRSAHAQINAGGEDHLSDRMLAYAMTLALPASFATIQQNLWLRSPLSSAKVAGAIQAEWARRKISDDPLGALVARQGFASEEISTTTRTSYSDPTNLPTAPSTRYMGTILQSAIDYTAAHRARILQNTMPSATLMDPPSMQSVLSAL